MFLERLNAVYNNKVRATPAIELDQAIASRNHACITLQVLGINPSEHPALIEAFALTFYGLKTRTTHAQGLDACNTTRLKLKLRGMVNAEVLAQDSSLPQPTIGFEVEIPMIHATSFSKYKDLFDNLGFPDNKSNKGTQDDYYEVSTSPSASHQVQMQILNMLIGTELLPSVIGSTDPEKIRKYLADCLISLHINLGGPRRINKKQMETLDTTPNTAKIFPWMISAALSLAYTSPERLKHRKSSVDYRVDKSLIPTQRNGTDSLRIELRALEVRDRTVYQLIQDAQLLGLLYFAKASHDSSLIAITQYLAMNLNRIFADYGIKHDSLSSKDDSAVKASDTELGDKLRLLLKRTRQAANFYQKTQITAEKKFQN